MNEAPMRKVFEKVPSWSNVNGLTVPGKLCSEQCSSERTAVYKAELAASAVGTDSADSSIADLTGGLGVDCWAFSKVFGKVLYNERDHTLAEAAENNFKLLGCGNIELHNGTFDASRERMLREFKPDIVYLDPARRSGTGKKVFRLEDCEPDVLTLLPILRNCTGRVMLKLSPMADISLLRRQLGTQITQIHIVSSGNEVKEILVLMDFTSTEECEPLIVASDTVNRFEFLPSEEENALAAYPESINIGDYLFEPDPAVIKSGAFKLPCSRFSVRKAAPSTHLYFSREPLPFGKSHRIGEVLDFNKHSFQYLKEKYGRAEITARNLPVTSDELRKKTGIPQGGNAHIFAFTARLDGQDVRKIVISGDI